MIDLDTWKKGWALLDRRERRNAGIALGVLVVAALFSAVMVGSIMPFLSVLSDPERIQTNATLAWLYGLGGFTDSYDFLVALGAGALAVVLAANLVQVARVYVVVRFATMRMHTISHRLLAAYLRQPYEYFLDHHTGSMGTQVLAESEKVVQQFFRPAGEVIASSLTVLALVGVLLWVDPLVALLAFAGVGGIYGGTLALSRRLVGRLGRIRVDTNQQRYRIANEALGGVKDIKLLGREHAYVDRYTVPSRRMAQTQARTGVIAQTPQYVMQAVAFGGMIILCLVLLDPAGLASGRALGGIVPTVGVFAFAGQRLIPELQKLYQNLTQLNFGRAAVDTVYRDMLETEGWATDLPRRLPSPLGMSADLRLENVSYRYPNAERPGLRDVSLRVTAGERIGVVGTTGAGKTTLADVVLGLLPPTDGRLVADGHEITDSNLRAWQQTVGYVPQHIYLTDATVAENIALGVPPAGIDQERVRRAGEIAQLDRFVVEELPAGYDTTVGERGVRLSGGQRQRVGIARALYHDADLIVFDEATSALDNLTEHEVMEAIEALPGDKTVLMIAHRLSTVQRCDRILVLDAGQVVGCDRWQALMDGNAAFRRIAQVA